MSSVHTWAKTLQSSSQLLKSKMNVLRSQQLNDARFEFKDKLSQILGCNYIIESHIEDEISKDPDGKYNSENDESHQPLAEQLKNAEDQFIVAIEEYIVAVIKERLK
jgi:hypothetical protein